MYEGYVCYGGTELVNNARAAAYATVPVQCHGGDLLRQALGDTPYTSPELDDAPWFDPAVPESGRFHGLAGLEVVGGDGTGTTAFTDLLLDGAVPGPLRRGPREVQVSAVALAADDTALSYGVAWLASALRGDVCGGATDLSLLAAHPARIQQPPRCLLEEESSGGVAVAATEAVTTVETPAELGTQLLRRLFNVSLLEGPAVSGRRRLSRGWAAKVTWTVQAGTPYWYREPVLAADTADMDLSHPQFWSDYAASYDADAVWLECASAQLTQGCLTDPYATLPDCEPVTAPPAPQPPPDPCYPGGLYGTALRHVYRIAPEQVPQWFETLPILTIETGDRPLRRLTVRWWTNPLDRPASGDIDPCLICSQFSVAYIPERARFIIDYRTEQAVVECGAAAYAQPVLYGPNGSMYAWPVLECPTGLLLELLVDGRWQPSRDLRIRVELASREDAL